MNAPTTPKVFRTAAERLIRAGHPDAKNLTIEWSFCSRRFVIEDLAVAGMGRSLRLGKSVHDAGLAEIRRQLEYKADWYGTTLVVADRWYPSSRTCSGCGAVNADLTLSQRTWTCECGDVHDRDVNAAVNLKNLAVGSTVTACGDGSSGHPGDETAVSETGRMPGRVCA